MQWPFSSAVGVALTIGVGAVVLIALFTTGLAPILLGGTLVALVLYIGAILLINIHRWSTTLYDRGRRS